MGGEPPRSPGGAAPVDPGPVRAISAPADKPTPQRAGVGARGATPGEGPCRKHGITRPFHPDPRGRSVSFDSVRFLPSRGAAGFRKRCGPRSVPCGAVRPAFVRSEASNALPTTARRALGLARCARVGEARREQASPRRPGKVALARSDSCWHRLHDDRHRVRVGPPRVMIDDVECHLVLADEPCCRPVCHLVGHRNHEPTGFSTSSCEPCILHHDGTVRRRTGDADVRCRADRAVTADYGIDADGRILARRRTDQARRDGPSRSCGQHY